MRHSWMVYGMLIMPLWMLQMSDGWSTTGTSSVRTSSTQPTLKRFNLAELPDPTAQNSLDDTALEAYITLHRPQLSEASRHVMVEALLASSATHNVDPKLVAAVIAVESGFNPRAYNGGAIGLGQLMRGTAKRLGIEDPYSITQNVEGTTRYIVQMLDYWEGHEQQIPLALTSYLIGPGAAKKQEPRGFGQKAHAYVKRVLEQYTKIKFIGTATEETSDTTEPTSQRESDPYTDT